MLNINCYDPSRRQVGSRFWLEKSRESFSIKGFNFYFFLFISCLRNPASFLSKKDLCRSTQKDNMADSLLTDPVSAVIESSEAPLPSPTLTEDGYESMG